MSPPATPIDGREPVKRCGTVAIVGRPNVGKSTFLNHVVGQKLSITSRKPQTTRHHVLGIKTSGDAQIIYVDTPGLQTRPASALQRFMNREAVNALAGVDVVLFMVEASKWTDADQHVLERICSQAVPVILVVNKVDKVADKSRLLPYLQDLSTRMAFQQVVPISAQNEYNLDVLQRCIAELLPAGEWLFPGDQVTDRSERFLAAELIREKLLRRLGDEVPYGLSVSIEHYREENALVRIHAVIWVERKGHKAIVIGRQGQMLKAIGEQARTDLQSMLGKRVFLQTWVKIREKWPHDPAALRDLGYEN